MSVNTTFTYNGLPNCVQIVSGNMNVTSTAARNLGN
jgi:hypothetical protein